MPMEKSEESYVTAKLFWSSYKLKQMGTCFETQKWQSKYNICQNDNMELVK